ncbi:MAG: hypothetical protein IJ309_01990 [Clostridia bacterium]|nr:hypothetical protein [Clostridia bacterium]
MNKDKEFNLRRDVAELIFDKEGEKRAVINDGDEQIFYCFNPAEAIGNKIFESYKKRRLEIDGHQVFYSDERSKSAGFLSDIYGNTGIISLMNRLNATLSNEDKKELVQSIYSIIDYIGTKGTGYYTLYPYISQEDNKLGNNGELFNKNFPYIGSMTWALSLFVQVRKAYQRGDLPISEEYNDKIVELIRKIIEFFNSSFIDDGESMGWSFTTGCETPSLFFTYSVLEAYSDFDDNIINESVITDESGNSITVYSDPELLEAINDGRGSNDQIHVLWKEKCFKVADKVWDIYKDILKDSFVDDTFLSGFKPISRDDILKSNSSNALFNTIHIVFILFYGYVNTRKADAGDEVGADDVVQTMNAALQNVQRIYDQFKRDGIEYIVDTYYIGFKSKHTDSSRRDLYTRKLNSKMLIDAKLMPTLVKANNVIAYHIDKYPVKQMSRLFLQLLENLPKAKDEYVWEAGEYDVKITERYIESIADFYDYYNKYERLYSQAFQDNSIILEKEKVNIEDEAIKRKRRAFREENKKQVAEEEARIRGEYTIENAIRQSVKESTEKLILDAFRNITNDNNNSGKVTLSSFEKELAKLIPDLLLSLMSRSIADGCGNADAHNDIRTAMKKDSDEFIRAWAEQMEKKLDTTDKNVISKLLSKEDK